MFDEMKGPDVRTIVQYWQNQWPKELENSPISTMGKLPMDEAQQSLGFQRYVIDVVSPGQFLVNNNAQVA